MLRRPSTTESTSSSGGDVTFDDVDDSQVFAFLDEAEEQGVVKPSASRAVEFRLDFSSRVNPAPGPPPAIIGSPPMSRRSSTNSVTTTAKQANANRNTDVGTINTRMLQRSPSMRSSAALPFRKRLSRRPSEPIADASVIAAAASIMKVTSVRPESPPSSPPPSPPGPLPIAVGPSLALSQAKASPSKSPVAPSADSSIPSAATASALAMASAAAIALEERQEEVQSLRNELQQTRSAMSELQEKLRSAEQQNESLSSQLIAVQDAYEEKLRTSYENAAIEREETLRQHEAALLELRDQLADQRSELQQEMKAAVDQVQSELLIENERLQRKVFEEAEQNRHLSAQREALQIELKRSQAERQLRFQSDASLETKCLALQASADHWEAQCQSLQDQVHQLLHEQEQSRRREAIDQMNQEKKRDLQKAMQQQFTMQVQLLQSQLKTLATEMREMVKKEMKKTTHLLTKLQQQASEMAIQQNEKAMALVAKQNRIIQLETQLKNERQSVSQLDLSLAKTTRMLEKKEVLFKTKYHEQKEFLDITVAVRNGLANELQTERRKVEDLELQYQELQRAKESVERKNRHLVQQVKIMQHVHAREMEEVALLHQQQQGQQGGGRRMSVDGAMTLKQQQQSKARVSRSKPTARDLSTRRTSTSAVDSKDFDGVFGREAADEDSSQYNRRHKQADDDVVAAQEWCEFVELTALHEAECRRSYQTQPISPSSGR